MRLDNDKFKMSLKEFNKIDWSKVHSCEKSEGKIISIVSDLVGNTYCGYCRKMVDYKKYFKQINL